jgi:predicted membrane protein
VALAVVGTVERIPFDTLELGDAGTRAFTPATVDALDGQRYEFGTGDLTFDLSALDFTERDAELAVDLGAGTIVIEVPADVTVEVDAELGAGSVDLLGERAEGIGIDRSVTDEVTADGAGTLELDIQVGLGEVEVRRAAA